MFTQFDAVVSVVAFIFMTLGFFKGAIKSILGLAKWYGAGVLTLLFYPKASEIVASYIQPGMLVNGIAIFVTYIAALIVLSIVIGIFVAALGSSVGGPSDRLMGAIVGTTIGLIIASTAHYFVRSFGGNTDPQWLKDGMTYSVTSVGADKLQGYFKDVIHNMGSDVGIIKEMDPTGSIADKIKQFQDSTGSQIDMEKLKEAIRIMKEDGLTPEQIKDLINIQDYMAIPQKIGEELTGGANGQANGIVNDAVKAAKQYQQKLTPENAPIAIDDQE